ncbi:MAG TPA: hypothetical protein VFN38_17805, partial [Gemmatimonadaceae bacterium]|nr:hypothetical protein [Gemmatimonadaceae bacterium]
VRAPPAFGVKAGNVLGIARMGLSNHWETGPGDQAYGRRQTFGSTDRIEYLGPFSGTSRRIAGSMSGSPGINVSPQTTAGFEATRASGD